MTTVDSEKIDRVVDLVLSPCRMFVLDKGTGESILCLEGLVRHGRRSPQAVLMEVAQAHVYPKEFEQHLNAINQTKTTL